MKNFIWLIIGLSIVGVAFAGFEVKNNLVVEGTTTLNGQLRLAGSGIVWDDIRISAQSTSINPVTSKPDYDDYIGTTQTFLFDPDTKECVTFSAQLPHSYVEGTDMEHHVHRTPTDTNTGGVVWELSYSRGNIGTALPTSLTVGSGVGTASGINLYHYMTDVMDLTGAGMTVSSMLVCKLCRDADNGADTYGSDVAFLENDFHFKKDSIGSTHEDSKD